MRIGPATPIFRMFDQAKAREFYVDYLGFAVVFEHRFEENFPLYMGLERDGLTLHLSEHHGDCCPGGAIRVEVQDIAALHREIQAKNYGYANPGIEDQPWGTREVSVTDPFGNRLTFFQDL